METSTNQKVGYNSTYISMNLIDELDHFLGGYAKPNIEFMFSLNTFVESFIACSSFYTSLSELKHIQLASPALFPKGRPILNLITKACSIRYVDGVVETNGRELYSDFDPGLTRKEAEHRFVSNFGKNRFSEYLIPSSISSVKTEIPLLISNFENGKFSVSEIRSSSNELISNLLKVATHNSIQTTLPLQLFSEQVLSLTNRPYSIKSLESLASLFDESVESLKKSLDYTFLPIPPFTNILLSQIRNISEIPYKLGQLRADYQQLRDQFVKLEDEVHGAASLKEQSDAYARFQEFWKVFNRKYLDENSRIIYGLLDINEPSGKDRSGWLYDRKVVKRYKGLTNIWDLFGNSKNIGEQLKHFERLFGVQYNLSEINGVHSYVKSKFGRVKKSS
ncbi:hypothetical protein [Pedobacter sp.]|uniref:hypothetical protein n=1 Tax=Pedobacter sp. TaxID=1411316 RepID=UPI003BAC057E